MLQTEKGVQDSGQKELQSREDHQRSGRQSGGGLGQVGCRLRQTKETDRELGSHRRMRGWGRARDNSTIVRGGLGGAGPPGQETGPFPLHRGGAPGRRGELAAF